MSSDGKAGTNDDSYDKNYDDNEDVERDPPLLT